MAASGQYLAQELDRERGLPSPKSKEYQARQGKRRREEEEEEEEEEERQDIKHEVPQHKRRRHSGEECSPDVPVLSHDDLVRSWVCNDGEWSKNLKDTTTMSDRQPRAPKRSPSSSSAGRTGSSSSGGPNGWWTNRHAEVMHDGGLIMEERGDIKYTQEAQKLCDQLLAYDENLPGDWYLKEPECRKVMEAASYKNEQRVERDVAPIICPSSELLSMRGYTGLNHIKEGLNAEWTKCTTLFGPKPKPDGCYGVSRHALTKEENDKLSFSTTAECEGSIFQFIIRQAKRSDGAMLRAERQAMHNASVACNTMVELYESIGAAQELDRQILAFSMSHNHETVRMFAHFAVIGAGKKTFHRRLMYATDLLSLSSDCSRPYKITLGIFRHFFPLHLRRIQAALARRPDHSIGPSTAQLSDDGDGQEGINTPPSSQEGSQSKKTSLASTVALKQENERLRVQLLDLIQTQRDQTEHQRIESRQQRELLEHQLEETRQQRLLLERQLEQMQEEARQQKEEARQQKEEARQQKEEARQQKEEARQQKEEARQQQSLLMLQLEQMQEDARQHKEEARQWRDESRQRLAQQQNVMAGSDVSQPGRKAV